MKENEIMDQYKMIEYVKSMVKVFYHLNNNSNQDLTPEQMKNAKQYEKIVLLTLDNINKVMKSLENVGEKSLQNYLDAVEKEFNK